MPKVTAKTKEYIEQLERVARWAEAILKTSLKVDWDQQFFPENERLEKAIAKLNVLRGVKNEKDQPQARRR